MQNSKRAILLTGATGYIGGRLLKVLEKEDSVLTCLARQPDWLKNRVNPQTRVVKGDVLDKKSLLHAMQDVDIAYYLVHSLGVKDFSQQDRQGAISFAEAASESGLKRIVYLGALGDRREKLSSHLESRQEVGDLLREKAKGVQIVEFRASIIIGAGSLSFEMIRALCERLPMMIAPKWVWTEAQPIAIQDVLSYLHKAADIPLAGNPIFEIGGKEISSYGGVMLEYMRQRHLHRLIIPVPVLTPNLSSLWLALVTPLYAKVGRKLVESARYATVVRDHFAEEVFAVSPMNVHESIAAALATEDLELRETHWFDALSSSGLQNNWAGARFGNRLIDSRAVEVAADPEEVFTLIRRMGGYTGWYYGNALWKIRGFLDVLIGGVGLKRGRRHPDNLRVGDAVDFWRVEALEPNHRLLLQAEMKLPGRAWLEFRVEPTSHGALIRQTAIFDPIGLSGLFYWYGLYPIHRLVFAGMLRGIARRTGKKIISLKK